MNDVSPDPAGTGAHTALAPAPAAPEAPDEPDEPDARRPAPAAGQPTPLVAAPGPSAPVTPHLDPALTAPAPLGPLAVDGCLYVFSPAWQPTPTDRAMLVAGAPMMRGLIDGTLPTTYDGAGHQPLIAVGTMGGIALAAANGVPTVLVVAGAVVAVAVLAAMSLSASLRHAAYARRVEATREALRHARRLSASEGTDVLISAVAAIRQAAIGDAATTDHLHRVVCAYLWRISTLLREQRAASAALAKLQDELSATSKLVDDLRSHDEEAAEAWGNEALRTRAESTDTYRTYRRLMSQVQTRTRALEALKREAEALVVHTNLLARAATQAAEDPSPEAIAALTQLLHPRTGTHQAG